MDCKEEALKIMPYAIEFYGSKYKHIIEEVLSHTEFKVIDDATNKNRQGGYFYKIIGTDFTHEVSIRNIEDPLYRQAILTHELFGHAVLSHEQPFTKIDGTLYIRNGICLRKCFGDEKSINLMANEGMVEYIASHIMKLYEPSYKMFSYNEYYMYTLSIADLMFRKYGKKKMLSLLVENKGNINKLYDSKHLEEWDLLSKELDKEKPDLIPYVKKLVK